MSSIIPKVGRINIFVPKYGKTLQNVRTPKLKLPGTPESGKASAYLNKTDPRKNIIPPGTLRKYSERRFNIEPYYTIPGDPYAVDVNKRLDSTLFRPITKPSSSNDFEDMYKINIGENMSYSKEVLKEFQSEKGGGGGGVVRIGGLRPGTSVGAGRVPFTGKNINPNVRMGLNYLYKNLGGIAGVMGKPPQTPGGGGGSGAGSGGEKGFIRDSLSDLISGIRKALGFFGAGALIAIGVYKYVTREGKRILDQVIDTLPLTDKQKEWLKANTMIVIIAIGLTAGTAEAARRLTPRIMKVLRNRRIAAEIGEALDAGDETMARTILLDAIEDENINLSAIRRKLGDDDYERLYRDYL